MRHRSIAAATVAVVAIILSASATFAYPPPGFTEHISVGPDGSEGNHNCFDHDVSADGRYVVFTCSATNLVANDTNSRSDIFVRDRLAGTTEIVSLSTDGMQGNKNSFHPSVTADGRFVAFASDASNLVVDDDNGERDVFLRDLAAGTTTLVSRGMDGSPGDDISELPSISADGNFLAFQSQASNLVPGDTNGTGLWPFDIFVRDLSGATTERVSLSTDGAQQNARAHRASISGDGRYVAFQSLASNLVAGDTNNAWDVFVHDRDEDSTVRVSESSAGEQGDGTSLWAAISADGRFVAFESEATNLVPSDNNQEYGGSGNDDGVDVFVHDLEAGTTERVSLQSNGAERPDGSTGPGRTVQAEDQSSTPSISADGRFVAYENSHIEAAEGQPGLFLRIYDVHVHDRLTGATEVVTVTTDGENPRGTASYMPSISADGRYVTFTTHANNIAPSARNNAIDVFVRDRGPSVGTFALTAVAYDDGRVDVSGVARFSGAIVSTAVDAPGDAAPAGSEAGGELESATVVLRPEEEDLLLKMSLAGLPAPTAGLPGIVYGFRFEVDGVVYEARALRVGAASVPPEAPHFALYRCAPVCVEDQKLGGGIGTTGNEVRVAVPVAAIGGGPDVAVDVTDVRAFTALGEAAAGEVATLDDITLPNASLSVPIVHIAIVPAGTSPDDDGFDTAADVTEGDFAGSLDISSVLPGDYDVWARACLGDICGASAVPFVVEGEVAAPTDLELVVDGVGIDRTLTARLMDRAAPPTGIAGKTIDFYAGGQPIGSATTNDDGIATLPAPPGYRGGAHEFEARFAGDDEYLGSSAQAQSDTGRPEGAV